MAKVRDTSIMEYTAEDLISHKLQRANILVAKPKFDQEGTDLLAFLELGDGTMKFCKIQCKGRSLQETTYSNVKIPGDYVTDAFVLFLWIETRDKAKDYLFCCMPNEIREWRTDTQGQYVLNISLGVLAQLQKHKFDDTKIEQIKTIIKNADVKKEVFGILNITLDDMVAGAPILGNPIPEISDGS